MTQQFHGVVPPLLTPRTSSGDLDFDSLGRLVDHLITGGSDAGDGVHGIFVLGSSGEVPYLTSGERDTVLRETIRAVDGRVPVLVGASEQTTKRVIEEGQRLLAIGGEAIVVTTPFYALSNATEIATHFRQIRAALDVPLFAYDIPVRTHQKIPLPVAVQLAEEGVLAGVKDSSADDVALRQLVLRTRHLEFFQVFTGHEVVADGALLAGASGVVPGLGNVDPAGYVRLFRAATEQRWTDAAREQDRLARLFDIVTVPDAARVSPGAAGLGAFKTALTSLGVLNSNRMSEPMASLDAAEASAIEEILRETGLA